MELKGILAISGKPGLYKMLSQSKNSIIVEGLDDKKRFPVYAAHQISALEEISIYTETDDVALADVFKGLYEAVNGEAAISHKSSRNELEALFAKALPDYDRDRVYVSDIKKVIQWYNILHRNGLMVFDEEKEADDAKQESPTAKAGEEAKGEDGGNQQEK